MFECLRFGVLYEGGGLADQPAGLLRRMRAAYNVYNAMLAWRDTKSMQDFTRQHPQEWQVVQMVLKLRQQEQPEDGSAAKNNR
jgi:hypothetical protein